METNKETRRLEPSELLGVMDAAQVLRARKERVEEDVFDREATIREIQTLYEEVGDLVDRDVIERALDQYVTQRYAFSPAPRNVSTALAWGWIRRGMLTRRVMAPAAVVVGVIWAGTAVDARVTRERLEVRAADLRTQVVDLEQRQTQAVRQLDDLRASPVQTRLAPEWTERFTQGLRTADDELASTQEEMEALKPDVGLTDPPSTDAMDAVAALVAQARVHLTSAEAGLAAAADLVQRRERLDSLSARVETLIASIRTTAREPGVAQAQRVVAEAARDQAGRGDLEALQGSVRGLDETLDLLRQEYRVEITGGVWGPSGAPPEKRIYYLLVHAVDARGQSPALRIHDESTGRVEPVREWGERVPKEVYDRVGADKADNGVIDEKLFGTKRLGWITLDRRYPDVGQVTRW